MTVGDDRTLKPVEVARALFRTAQPTPAQLQRVCELQRAGALPARRAGRSPASWTTTESALAEFLAARQMHKAHAQRGGAAPADEPMRGIYRHLWCDYFLALLWRRRMAHRSRVFHRAVLAGQVGALALIFMLPLGALRQFDFGPSPAEHTAIQQRIAASADEFRILRWHPPAPAAAGGVEVRVEYRYRLDSPRWIHTDRTYRVADDAVTELSP